MDHDGDANDIRANETVATWPVGSFAEKLVVVVQAVHAFLHPVPA